MMKKRMLVLAVLCMLLLLCACSSNSYRVGAAMVDITPEGSITIAGNTEPAPASKVDFPLYVKAVVIEAGKEQVAIVTIDTLKYPVGLVEEAMKEIEKQTGIPADHITITASHTHSGPHYADYNGALTQIMADAVKAAKKDMEPCKLGVASAHVEGASHCRRILIDGEAWNDWMVSMPQAWHFYPAVSEIDPDVMTIAAVDKDGNFKTILWNYACHANSNIAGTISADYPGRVQAYVQEMLGSDVPLLFLTGACGNVNANNSTESVGSEIGEKIIDCLLNLTYIEDVSISTQTEILELEGRENPVFNEEEIAEKWPDQLESYRRNFESTLNKKGTTRTYLCGIAFGKTAAIITNPGELFSDYGLAIKEASPFAYTIVTEQTNGAIGYVPTVADFDLHGYETWFGEHSNLCAEAGDLIEESSNEILNALYGGE